MYLHIIVIYINTFIVLFVSVWLYFNFKYNVIFAVYTFLYNVILTIQKVITISYQVRTNVYKILQSSNHIVLDYQKYTLILYGLGTAIYYISQCSTHIGQCRLSIIILFLAFYKLYRYIRSSLHTSII